MDVDFATDKQLFASLPGGQAIIDWFGFCPSFHDASLEKVELSAGAATLQIRTFRMNSETDAEGHHVLDRHALVTLRMSGVTGVKLEGEAGSIIGELAIRRVEAASTASDWPTCGGPEKGDIQVAFDTAVGLEGAVYAKGLAFSLEPVAMPSA